MVDLQSVGDAYRKLHPRKFYARTGEWLRGGLPAASLGGDGGRSANRPEPHLDAQDVNVEALVSSYCADLRGAFVASRMGDYAKAVTLLEHARATESGVLPELHMSAKDWIAWRKEKSRQADEEASLRNMRAVKCKNPAHEEAGQARWVERTKDDPLCGGRCHSCHVYWKKYGRDRNVEMVRGDVEAEAS